LAEQERTQYRYQYSVFQLEYSRTLLFWRGSTLDEVYEKLLDRTRGALEVKTLKTIFGRKHRPHNFCKKRGSKVRLEKVIERPSYDLTVFKLHFGKWTLKIYDKGDRVLRVEIVAHNVKALNGGTVLERLPQLLQKMRQHVKAFLNVVQAAHVSFLDEGALDTLALPTQQGSKRLAGIDLNRSGMRTVVAAVVALSPQPGGFSRADLARKVQEMVGWKPEQYSPRRAAYDLAKIRGKDIVERAYRSCCYVAKAEGIRKLCAYTVLRERVLKPIMAGAGRPYVELPPKNIHPLDVHYQNLLRELEKTFQTLGLAA
jgi:hypothetical protein